MQQTIANIRTAPDAREMRRRLQDAFAAAIAEGARAVVEVTLRGADTLTLSGRPDDVEQAATWCAANLGWTEDGARQRDDEDPEAPELYVYFSTAAAQAPAKPAARRRTVRR